MVIARNLLRGLTVPLLVLGMGSAQAAMLEGETVTFSWTGDLGLFGEASVSGDTLRFDPTEFVANAAGPGIVTVSATTPTITIQTKPGFVLAGGSLLEQGDYFRIEAAGDPITTLVGAGGQAIVNGTPLQLTAGGLTASLSPEDVVNSGLMTTPWSITHSAALGGTSIEVKLQNILVAGITGGLEAAFIEKKLVEIGIDTAVIPVPPAVWMLGSALFGLAAIGRRRLAS